ncbi:MAG: glycosyl-4,4'-diaponeurosporenoate acyltransferase [Acidimicrobiales bacterium]
MPSLSRPVLIALDAGGCLVLQVGAGYLVHRLPVHFFAEDRWLFRTRRVETGGRVYERVLRVRRWKPLLPEAGALFRGGFDKSALRQRGEALLATYVGETRRAELGHWLPLVAAPLFLAFNPWYAGAVVLLYAVVANLPCIAAQRYNRIRLQRLQADRRRRQRKIAER